MRRWVLSLTVFTLLFVLQAAALVGADDGEVELIANGSFEEIDAAGRPVGFGTWVATGKPDLAVESEVAHTGERSLRISGDGSARATFNHSVKVSGGAYRVSLWVRKTPSVQDSQIVLRIMAFYTETGHDEDDKVPWSRDWVASCIGARYEIHGRNFSVYPLDGEEVDGWRRIQLTFVLPEDVVRLHIDMFNWFANGTIWFDDLSLVRLPPNAVEVKSDGASTAEPQEQPMEAASLPAVDLENEPILERLKTGHPRLLVTEGDFARIKELVNEDPLAKQWYEGLKFSADRILYESVSRYEIPDGLRLLATSRRVLDRVSTLALAYQLTGDQRYVERTWKELKAAGEFPDWNPRHFLDTAEMTHAFALAYDWLYDQWSAKQRTFLRDCLVKKGLQPALECYRGQSSHGWWVRATHNWNLVCNGGITMGALAIADERPQLAEDLIRFGLKSVPRAIVRFAPDGGWDEGAGYWHYSIRYLVPYLSALESALGTDFGLSKKSPGLAETGYFPMYLTGPFQKTFNFADSGSGLVRAPELFWLAWRYNKSEYAWWQQEIARGGGYFGSLLWYQPELVEGFDLSSLPLDRYFRGVEIASFRSAWDDPDGIFLALKAGDNSANHGDLDNGTFVLDALGVRWAEELGADDYNLPGYFSGGARWSYYRKRTEGQNTLVINPGDDPGQDPSAVGRIVFHHFGPQEALAIADLTPAYRWQATKVERGFALFDNRRQVLIQDEITTHRPADAWWFMHTRAEVEIDPAGGSAILRQDGKQLLLRVLSPAGAEVTVMPARPLPTSPDPKGQAQNAGLRKVAIHLPKVTRARLAVQLVPLKAGEVAPMKPEVIPLSEWRKVEKTNKPLWDPQPRMTIEVVSPRAGSEVYGSVPLELEVTSPTGIEIERVSAWIDQQLVFEGPGLPDGATVDTRQFEDGAHTLFLKLVTAGGGGAHYSVRLVIDNWWHLLDPLKPPTKSAWFGEIDFSKTASESPGWRYAADSPEDFHGDRDRKLRKENTTEYLVWETPNLQRFIFDLYSKVPDIKDVVVVAVAADAETWVEVPYQLQVVQESERGWYHLKLTGEAPWVSAGERGTTASDGCIPGCANWLRLTFVEGAYPPEHIQLGALAAEGMRE